MTAFMICMLYVHSTLMAQNLSLPPSAPRMLDRRFPGWKFAQVSQEIHQFFKSEMKGESPHLISGDFDGNGKPDYAVLIWHGHYLNDKGAPVGPKSFLVVFIEKRRGYRMHVIKDPEGEYLCLARKGTEDYDYEKQKEIRYVNDSIMTGIFEKGGSSYVFEKGRFRSFVSSD